MDHYLLTARSVTHAQQMAQALGQSGIYGRVRRIGAGVSKSGCGYTLEVPQRQFSRAAGVLREAGVLPVKAFFVSNGERHEVSL